VLQQVKGGSAAWPSTADRERLREVSRVYKAKAVLLSQWKKGSRATFYRLIGDERGEPIDPAEAFSSCGMSKSRRHGRIEE